MSCFAAVFFGNYSAFVVWWQAYKGVERAARAKESQRPATGVGNPSDTRQER